MSDPVLDTIDSALHDYEVSTDAMRWRPEHPPVAVDYEKMRIAFRVIGQHVSTQMRAVAKAAQQVGKVYLKVAHRLMDHDRVRCRICRPYSNPRPLRLGAEYHRRRRNRR